MKSVKAVFSVLLLFVFLSSTLGVQVYEHYCGDFLEEVSVFIQSNPCMDEGGEDACSASSNAPSCCEDEEEYYQLDIDLVNAKQQNTSFKIFPVLIASVTKKAEQIEELTLFSGFNKEIKVPPKIPIYKRLMRLTYYG